MPKATVPPDPEPRIAPLDPPYDEETAAMLSRWMPPNRETLHVPDSASSDAEPLALFRTLAVHADLASRMRPFGAGILGHGLLPPRMRELMIDRTCALCGAEYEWGVHAVAFGASVGLTPDLLAATVHGGSDADVWEPAERAVLALADALHRRASIDDDLFAELRTHFDDAQILELTATAGWYHTIAFIIAVARVPLEPWAARFPPKAAAQAP